MLHHCYKIPSISDANFHKTSHLSYSTAKKKSEQNITEIIKNSEIKQKMQITNFSWFSYYYFFVALHCNLVSWKRFFLFGYWMFIQCALCCFAWHYLNAILEGHSFDFFFIIFLDSLFVWNWWKQSFIFIFWHFLGFFFLCFILNYNVTNSRSML